MSALNLYDAETGEIQWSVAHGESPIVCDHPLVHAKGVYFGMPEDEYHAAFGLSSHGVSWLRMSGFDFWARCPALNPQYEDENDSEAKQIGRAYDARICEGRDIFLSRYAAKLDQTDYPEALTTNEELHAALARYLIKMPKSTVKADLVERLLAVQPDAVIWQSLTSEHANTHAGKTLLPAKTMDRIELAAAYIEREPDLSKAFSGGAPQVSVFWTDEYGIPCRARFDYWKSRAIIDLKTTGRDYLKLKAAFARDIAIYRYYRQARFYVDAAEIARDFVCRGEYYGDVDPKFIDALKSVRDGNPYTFMWAVQRKGVAPMAKGLVAPSIHSGTMTRAAYDISEAKQTFVRCWRTFGAELPWLEPEGIEEYADEDLFIRDDD